jgi:hypothetical protein
MSKVFVVAFPVIEFVQIVFVGSCIGAFLVNLFWRAKTWRQVRVTDRRDRPLPVCSLENPALMNF